MTVPVKVFDESDPDDYGLSTVGHDFIQGGSDVRQVIEILGITTDEDCEKIEKQLKDHPEWGDNIPDEPLDDWSADSRT